MDISLDPLDTEVVAAVFAVLVDGVSATHAWLEYVRERHPETMETLAKKAVTDLTLDLLVANGDIASEEAEQSRAAAAEAARRTLPRGQWGQLNNVRRTLELLEAHIPPNGGEVIDVTGDASGERPARVVIHTAHPSRSTSAR